MCESGNNYQIKTGNDHYGAYQFDLPTWRSVGGSGYPNLASPAEQDARALILYRMRGWQPWQCAMIVGLQEDSSARSGRTTDIKIGGGSVSSSPGAPALPGPHYFHYGDHSPTIKRFQDQMHARGYFPVGTGDYGPNTLAMVKRLQSLNGLVPNGEIGPNTWRLAWTGRYSAGGGPTVAADLSAPVWPGLHNFHYGDHSPTIKRFQDQMHARGYFPVGTGDYGPNTLAVVKRLQSLNGLIPNGEIGPNTWRLAWTGRYSAAGMSTSASTAPPWPGPHNFHYGDHSPTIKRFQDQMHGRGYFPVGTSDYGPNTLAMVKRLQSLNGLIPNGEIGPNTWRLAWTGTYGATIQCASQPSISSCGASGYVNPFAAGSWIPERTDQGTDWGAIQPQPVVAIGDGVITYSNSQQSGWPAGKFLVYQLRSGSHAGLYIFVAENLTNLLPAGTTVKAGQQIAVAVPGGPDIETGFAAPPGTGPNVATPYNGAADGTQTAGGKAFARFLIKLGAHPQQDPGPGPDRP